MAGGRLSRTFVGANAHFFVDNTFRYGVAASVAQSAELPTCRYGLPAFRGYHRYRYNLNQEALSMTNFSAQNWFIDAGAHFFLITLRATTGTRSKGSLDQELPLRFFGSVMMAGMELPIEYGSSRTNKIKTCIAYVWACPAGFPTMMWTMTSFRFHAWKQNQRLQERGRFQHTQLSYLSVAGWLEVTPPRRHTCRSKFCALISTAFPSDQQYRNGGGHMHQIIWNCVLEYRRQGSVLQGIYASKLWLGVCLKAMAWTFTLGFMI